MVNAAREPLHGDVEIDDTWIGGPQPGIKGSRQLKDRRAVPVLVAVERREDRSGRIRMWCFRTSPRGPWPPFSKEHVARGSTVYTDGLGGFAGWLLAHRSQATAAISLAQGGRLGRAARGPRDRESPALADTYHGVSRAQLQAYLDEFVFRHNRRKQPMAAFQTLLGLGTDRTPTPYRRIQGGRDRLTS